MNYKQIAASVLALGVTAVANAAQVGAREAPDFVFSVPMDLKNIPGEVHTVVVWCEALNATYGGAGVMSREAVSGAGTDPKLLQFRSNGPQVIASTGAIEIPVQGHSGQAAARAEAMKQGKPMPPWSVDRIEMMARGAKPLSITAGKALNPAELASVPGAQYMIVPKAGGSPASNNLAVALYANTVGATDPALGTAYACHMGFKASTTIDGKLTNFEIFAGQGSYENMPDENAKDPAYSDARGGRPNPAKTLHVYGNFPSKDAKPAGK